MLPFHPLKGLGVPIEAQTGVYEQRPTVMCPTWTVFNILHTVYNQPGPRPAWIARDAESNIKLVSFLENEDKSQLVIRTYDQFLVAQKNEKNEAQEAKDGEVKVTTYSDYRDEETEAAKFHTNYQSSILNLFRSGKFLSGVQEGVALLADPCVCASSLAFALSALASWNLPIFS